MPDTNSVTDRLNQYRLTPPTLTLADLQGLLDAGQFRPFEASAAA
jgi:hypothetical protein